MSLINQMLKDLETRQTGPLSATTRAVQETGPASRRRWRLLLAGLVVSLLLGGLTLRHYLSAKEKPTAPVAKPAVAAPVVQAADPAVRDFDSNQPQAVTSPAAIAEKPAARKPLPLAKNISLMAMRMQEFDNFIHFEADFDRPPAYHLALSDDRRSLRVELAEVERAAKLPVLAGRHWLQDILVEKRNAGLTINLVASKQAAIKDFSATVQVAGGGYRLLLDLHPELPAPAENEKGEMLPAADGVGLVALQGELPEASPLEGRAEQPAETAERPAAEAPLQRKERQPSAAELAEQAYRQGRAALAEGRSREGEAALRQALQRQPAHLAARQALTAELVRQRRSDQAGQLLEEGLRLHPEKLPLRMRYADLLVAQGAPQKALDLLLNGPQPSPLEAPRLHALQAALFQRLGRYLEAARAYQALLVSQPDNALWLMGLAIAREHAGATPEAVAAYRAALAGQGLSPALNSYVEQRLAALQAE